MASPSFNLMGAGGGGSNQYFANMPAFANPGQSQYQPSGMQPSYGGRATNVPYYNPMQGPQGPANPYQVPSSSASPFGPTYNPTGTPQNPFGGSIVGAGGGNAIVRPIDSGLTGQLFNFLQSQVGQGVTPFNLATMLPSGGMTHPGQLSAPLSQTLSTIANQGISALPEWQAMIDAQQRNIGQGAANLREQFAGMGGLAGSPFGQAMSDYQTQTQLGQNALLGQLQQQNILQGQIPVAQFGQAMDQQAIQNMYQEFIRTQPQYNPLLNLAFGGATTFPPTTQKQSGGGVLGGLLPGLLSGISGGAGAAAGGAGLGGSLLAGLAAI